MSETTEFKDVYEAIASVSPNRQNILYTVLEEDAFGEKAFFSDDKLVWEMSYRNAAAVMSKSEHQIKNLVYRGKQSLKAILEQEGFEYADE